MVGVCSGIGLILADFPSKLNVAYNKAMAIVTIGGNVGAGKTTLAARLAEALGCDELYVGGLMREVAADRGMTIEEFYVQLKHDPELERSIDAQQVKLMNEKENLVVQGRVAWYFAKQSKHPSWNVFLAVSPDVGAQRTGQRDENLGRPIDEIRRANVARTATELERYKSLYDIDNFLDPKYYDYVLDTTDLTEDEVLKKVIASIPGNKKGADSR